MTKLDIINEMLVWTGSPPVSDLTTNYNLISPALIVLESVIASVQRMDLRRAFYSNQRFIPDTSGHINLPADTYTVRLNLICLYKNTELDKMTIKDGKLYDMAELTDDFSDYDELYLDYSILMDFDDMSEVVKEYIKIAAIGNYLVLKGKAVPIQFSEAKRLSALNRIHENEMDNDRPALSDNPTYQRLVDRRPL